MPADMRGPHYTPTAYPARQALLYLWKTVLNSGFHYPYYVGLDDYGNTTQQLLETLGPLNDSEMMSDTMLGLATGSLCQELQLPLEYSFNPGISHFAPYHSHWQLLPMLPATAHDSQSTLTSGGLNAQPQPEYMASGEAVQSRNTVSSQPLSLLTVSEQITLNRIAGRYTPQDGADLLPSIPGSAGIGGTTRPVRIDYFGL
ncbi:uncharacterized protein B0H18DRAFT_960189 [Fomitopsis serialis]|uniref:uncharacterized protein n=1 Tax=Fomitopsis serialis TaxID=139415 RepID=UPI002007364B|nr:uncharacterized protein B0H18DRAFT_960189 [Neoantrodia serialis]KAH9913723.1 hypothetical protein B0H18DRAFT_960189 [Neoantrodia serialis]